MASLSSQQPEFRVTARWFQNSTECSWRPHRDSLHIRCIPTDTRIAAYALAQYYRRMKLYVVTDIHNQPTQNQCFSTGLNGSPRVIRLALNELCGRPELTGEALHQHLFRLGGMDDVVSALKQTLKGEIAGLGYSAGGTAFWRAAVAGYSFTALFCVSSTRLRDEAAIATPNHVFFGSKDQGKPSSPWLETIPDQFTVFDDVGHTYYLQPSSAASHETRAQISARIRPSTAAPHSAN